MIKLKVQRLLLIISFFACFNAISQYIPYCQKGKWGFSTIEGKISVPCIYEEANFYSDDSLAKVKKEGKYGYINLKGKVVIPIEFEDCHRSYEVYRSAHTITINVNPDIHLNKDNWYPYDFKDNRYIAVKNKKNGVFSLKNGKAKVLIPFIYSKIQFDFSKKVFNCLLNNEIHFFSIDGEELNISQVNDIIVDEYDVVARNDDFMKPSVVEKDGKLGVIKISQWKRSQIDTLVPIIYEDIITDNYENYYLPGDEVFGVKLNRKWGFVDGKQNVLLSISYDSIDYELSKDYRHWLDIQRMFVVKQNNKWGVLGKMKIHKDSLFTLLPFEYDGISRIYYSFLVLKSDKGLQIYNIEKNKIISLKSYKIISKYKHESIGSFKLFETKNKLGKTVYIGENGIEFFTE